MKYFILIKSLHIKRGFDYNTETSLTAKNIKDLCEKEEVAKDDTEALLLVDGKSPSTDSDIVSNSSMIEYIVRPKKSPLKN